MSLAETVAAARNSVVLVPTDMGAIVAKGADRLSWLNGLVTCELKGLEPGHAIYGLAVAKKGRIVSDLIIVATDDALVVVVPKEMRDEVYTMFEHHLVMEDVELSKSDAPVYLLHGPRAKEVAGITAEFDFTGLGGAIAIGTKPSVSVEADDAAWEALRLEQGVPRFGRDFDTSTYPQEASLEKRAVSFDKGCYLGQEVVCMLELRGHVKQKLVPVTLSAGVPAGSPVTAPDGKEIGKVTSVAFGPTTNAHVGLAMVKRAFAEPGSVLHAGDATVQVR